MPHTEWNYIWINGEKVTLAETIDVLNPATGKVIGQVPRGGEQETKRAIDAAWKSFSDWSQLAAKERSNYLVHWADNLLQHRDKLASILTEEQGKPLTEAKGEIEGSAEFIYWYAEEAKRVYGETIPGSKKGQRITVLKQPVGVCGLITPWNFPGAMVARKVAPALAAGCTVILKPASQTPRIAIALFEQLMATGLPNGVANLITGDSARIGEALLTDERVRKISFTGSTEVGKSLAKRASEQVKRISLELGGNSPAIVFPDADIDRTAQEIVNNKFENCGQVCNGINVIYAHREIKNALVNKIVECVRQLNVGCGTQSNVHVGPLIDQKALDHVDQLITDAKQKGAEVLVGGEKVKQTSSADTADTQGYFYIPTVLHQVTPEMNIAQEEIFGPVAPVLTFDNEAEVLEYCNQSPYGLAAYLFTRDVNRVYRVSEALEAGMVAVNSTSLSVPQAPFGGIKESGRGREGGHHGLEEYLELKYITLLLDE